MKNTFSYFVFDEEAVAVVLHELIGLSRSQILPGAIGPAFAIVAHEKVSAADHQSVAAIPVPGVVITPAIEGSGGRHGLPLEAAVGGVDNA